MERSPDYIIEITARTLCVTVTNLKSSRSLCEDCQKARHIEAYHARHIATYFIKTINPELSFARIALLFNKKLNSGRGDHSGALYSFKKTKDMIETKDLLFIMKLEKVKQALNVED